MKKLIHLTCICLAIICSVAAAKANNLAGGDISHQEIGEDSFLVTLTVYANCNAQSLGNSQSVSVSSSCGMQQVTLQHRGSMDITPVCSTACNRCTSSSCTFQYGIKKYTYSGLAVLKNMTSSCCNVTFSWSACCHIPAYSLPNNLDLRLSAVVNRCVSGPNSSPVFAEDPPFVYCIGRDARVSFSAIQADLDSNNTTIDSLSYELKRLSYLPGGWGWSWSNNYDYSNPIRTFAPKGRRKGFLLDSTTGLLSFRPIQIGSGFTSISVSRFRNRKKIGETSRVFYLFVIACPKNSPPVISTNDLQPDQDGVFTVCNNSDNRISFTASDADTADSVLLHLRPNVPGAKDQIRRGKGSVQLDFEWIPDSSQAAGNPFYAQITAKDNACPIVGQASMVIPLRPVKSNWDYELGYAQLGSCTQVDAWIKDNNQRSSISRIAWYDDKSQLLAEGDSLRVIMDAAPFSMPIKVVIHDSQGCRRIEHDTIRVKAFSGPTMRPGKDTFFCHGSLDSIMPWHTGGIGWLSYEWTYQHDSTVFKANSRILPLRTLGEGIVSLRVADSLGCSISQSFKVSSSSRLVPEVPIVDSSFCQGETLIVLHKDSRGFVDTWKGASVMNDSIWIGASDTGVYQLAYVMFDKKHPQCSTEFEKQLRVKPSQPLSLGVDTSLCIRNGLLHDYYFPAQPIRTQFTGSQTLFNSATGQYYLAQGSLSNAGLYKFTIAGTDSTDCHIPDTVSIGAKPLAIPGFSQNRTAGRPPLDVTFSNQSGNQPNTVYQWFFGDGAGSQASSPSHTYSKGIYDVSLVAIDTLSGCSDTLSKSSAVRAVVPVIARFSATPLVGTGPLKVSLINSSTSDTADVVLEWRINDSLFSDKPSPDITLPAGLYSFSLTVRDTLTGLVDSSVQKDYVQVNRLITAGLGHSSLSTVNVYPNPSKGQLTISTEGLSGSAGLKVYSTDGRLLKTISLEPGTTLVDVGGLASGTYFYRLVSAHEHIATGTLVIE